MKVEQQIKDQMTAKGASVLDAFLYSLDSFSDESLNPCTKELEKVGEKIRLEYYSEFYQRTGIKLNDSQYGYDLAPLYERYRLIDANVQPGKLNLYSRLKSANYQKWKSLTNSEPAPPVNFLIDVKDKSLAGEYKAFINDVNKTKLVEQTNQISYDKYK
jgi:hypothetical protein